jgi:predicted Rossmann fold nucleotide-binding protein DprA/Smf involved in DNA uptake
LEHLVISQVPILFYKSAPYPARRIFLLERNITLSALAAATIIFEAGEAERIASLYHASAALAQGRQLMIHETCFESGATWPQYLADRGAIRVASNDEIRQRLHQATVH